MVFFLFGLVKLIFGLPKSEEYPLRRSTRDFEILRALKHVSGFYVKGQQGMDSCTEKVEDYGMVF